MRSVSKKVCLLGDFAVGKTSLLRRFVYNRFDDRYMSTIGVKVSRKTLVLPGMEGEPVELVLLLWDLAGGDRFTNLLESYLRGSAGAILVCDLTRPHTLDALENYIHDLRGASPEAVYVLAANKQDLVPQDAVPQTHLQAFTQRHAIPYTLTSAKTGMNVDTLFRLLGEQLLRPQVMDGGGAR